MAAEFAYIFQTFGSRVTVLSRSGFLKDLDKHLRAIALKELDSVDIREGTAVTGIAGTSKVTGVRYRAGAPGPKPRAVPCCSLPVSSPTQGW